MQIVDYIPLIIQYIPSDYTRFHLQCPHFRILMCKESMLFHADSILYLQFAFNIVNIYKQTRV